MAKRKKTRKKPGIKIPLFTVAGVSATPAVQGIAANALSGNISGVLQSLAGFVGMSTGTFNFGEMALNIGLPALGGLASKFVGGDPINLNRRMNIPFIKF